MVQRIFIEKEGSSPALEEKFVIRVDPREASKYFSLIKRVWPNTKIYMEQMYA